MPEPVTADDGASRGAKPSMIELKNDVELTILGMHMADVSVSRR